MSHAGRFCAPIAGALILTSFAGAAYAAPILDAGFVYQAHNHPDGDAAEPYYGLRLDELYDATGGHDIFTMDFDYDEPNFTSGVFVSIFGNPGAYLITISGNAWGGRDINGSYANDSYLGVYSFSFTYNVGVDEATPDDDYIVTPVRGANSGTITTPLGDTIDLTDQVGANGYTFRLGDENSDDGHRGFDGVSGWGWLNHNNEPHVVASDWLFTVDAEPVPAPGPLALAGLGGAIGIRRRRR